MTNDTAPSQQAVGRQATLARSMGVGGVLFLTLSSVTPASSVFVIVPSVIAQAGTGAILSMAAAALLSVPIALIYAELSSAFPIAGGEYCMVGRTVGKGAGLAILGLTIFNSVLTPAALALGASIYIDSIIPGIDPRVAAVLIIAVTTALGILPIKTNALITGIFLGLELLALTALAGIGFLHSNRHFWETTTHPVWLTNGTLQNTSPALIGLATSAALFTYNGFGTAVYFAEEMIDASRLIARTVLLALMITVVAEMLPVIAVLLGTPNLKQLLAGPNPFEYSMVALGGRPFATVINIGILLAILNAVLATLLQNARFLYSTGRDDVWHNRLNGALMTIDPRSNAPWIATLITGAASILMCLLGLNLILVLTGTGVVIVYMAVSIAAISARYSGASRQASYRAPFYPALPILGLIGLTYVLYTSALDPAFGQPSLLANGAVVCVSALYYQYVLHRNGGWILRGPDGSGN